MKGIRIFLAEGFEETEALATLDVLRRGKIDALTVSTKDEGTLVTGSHGIPVFADMPFSEFLSGLQEEGTGPYDVMIFPGGMPGTRNLAAHERLMDLMKRHHALTRNLAAHERLMDLMKRHHALGGTVAAICAAPGLVVSQLDGLEGIRFTCYDGFEEHLLAKGAEYVKAPAVADGTLITGRGAGCAIDFGLKILDHLRGPEAAAAVRKGLMI